MGFWLQQEYKEPLHCPAPSHWISLWNSLYNPLQPQTCSNPPASASPGYVLLYPTFRQHSWKRPCWLGRFGMKRPPALPSALSIVLRKGFPVCSLTSSGLMPQKTQSASHTATGSQRQSPQRRCALWLRISEFRLWTLGHIASGLCPRKVYMAEQAVTSQPPV